MKNKIEVKLISKIKKVNFTGKGFFNTIVVKMSKQQYLKMKDDIEEGLMYSIANGKIETNTTLNVVNMLSTLNFNKNLLEVSRKDTMSRGKFVMEVD